MTGDTTRRTVLTGVGAAAILGGTGVAFAGGDQEEDGADSEAEGNGDEGNVASVKAIHASPDAPNVDVYVNDMLVLEDVAFGDVSDYLVLLDGEYDVMVIPTGESSDGAVISDTVEVPSGAATAVVVGEAAEDGDQPLELLLLEVEVDDLDDDESRVRAVHASPDAPAVDVVADDQVLASDLEFGDSEYVDVPAGSYTLEIRPAGEDEAVAEFDVHLVSNVVYSAYAVGFLEAEDDQKGFDHLLDVDAITPAAEGEDADEAAGGAEDETASVSFEEQNTDGTRVEVEEISVPDGGFVAIHDSSLLDGEVTGSVIGVSEYLEPGEHDEIDVDLYEGVNGAEFGQDVLEEDETLIAMPHRNTDDDEEYDFVESDGEDDGPYTEDGDAVVDDAEITLDDEEEAETDDEEDEEDEEEAETDDEEDEEDDSSDSEDASDDHDDEDDTSEDDC